MTTKKIIDGLYFTVGMMLFNPATGEAKTPDELNEDDRYTYDACMGAIELLKAQEPRLLDLSELTTVDDILWLEVKDRYLVCAQLEFDFTISHYWFSVMGEEEMVKELRCEYGKTWRCWTSCPAEEQRKAVKWE